MGHRRQKHVYIIMGIVFLFYLYMAMEMGPAKDDWTWGSAEGMKRLHHWFKNYNGRYLGNLTEILLMHSVLARLLIRSIFSAGVVYLLWRLTDFKSLYNGVVIFFLVLSLPVDIFAQTYGWGAGFCNYIPPAFLSLLYLNIIQPLLNSNEPHYPRGSWLWMIPLGFCSQLFIEHVTLYNLALAIGVMVLTWSRYRKIYLLHAIYFISALAGAIMMFSNGAYLKMFRGHYGFGGRSVVFTPNHASLFDKIIGRAGQIYSYYIFDNTMIIIALSFLCLLLLVVYKKRLNNSVSWLLSLVLVSYVVYKILWVDVFHIRFNGLIIIEGAFSYAFLLSVFFVIYLTIENKATRYRTIFYLVSSAFLAAPFLVVTPLSPRCFLSSYFMLILVVLELMNVVIKPSMWPVVLRIASVGVLSMLIMYMGVLTRLGHTTHLRHQEIQQQLADKTKVMIVTKYRYSQFMELTDPPKGSWTYKMFKLYYHIPKNVTVKFINHK